MKKWKLIKENERDNDVNGSYLINTYACPSCNWKVRTEGEMEYNFCPMCGEDLREKYTTEVICDNHFSDKCKDCPDKTCYEGKQK